MTLAEPSERTRLRTARLVVAILVVALVATPVLAFPYVLLHRDASRIDVRTDLAWVLLMVHVSSAALAMILGALQLVPRIQARRRVHRRIGRTFLGLGTLAFVATGIPLAITSPGWSRRCCCWCRCRCCGAGTTATCRPPSRRASPTASGSAGS
jgi:hypothetical protein